MRISFVISGEEIISGFRQDRNFAHAAKLLYDLGFSIYAEFVGDRKEDLLFALRCAEEFSDIVVCSGGLGSTSDDITRFVAAEYFGVSLEENSEAIAMIKKKFQERTGKAEIPLALRIQGMIPAGAEVIPNERGSAPGFKMEKNGKLFFFLPGVPAEFQQMFSHVMENIIQKHPTLRKLSSRTFRIFGLTETQIEREIKDTGIPEGIRISYFPSFPEVIVRIRGEEDAVLKISERVRDRLNQYIYSESENESFPEHISGILKERGLTVATAESLTGGELANMLTDVPGSSLYFKGGEIVYSNEAKLKLGVRRETLENFGAVSHECARELAEKVRERFRTDIGLATTGVAGPDPAEGKEPGLFYIGISTKDFTESFEFLFNFGRKYTKILCSYLALRILKDSLKKIDRE